MLELVIAENNVITSGSDGVVCVFDADAVRVIQRIKAHNSVIVFFYLKKRFFYTGGGGIEGITSVGQWL